MRDGHDDEREVEDWSSSGERSCEIKEAKYLRNEEDARTSTNRG